jgi:ADP-ribosylglycohydrolase
MLRWRTRKLSYADGLLPPEREMELVLGAQSEIPRGSGYVVDSLWSSMHCLLSPTDYEACVRRAIKLGNDTDTTACIAGGVAGLLYGYAGIEVPRESRRPICLSHASTADPASFE